MVYRLINRVGCWKNTRRIRKSRAAGGWFTNSSRVPRASRVVYQSINHRNLCSRRPKIIFSYGQICKSITSDHDFKPWKFSISYLICMCLPFLLALSATLVASRDWCVILRELSSSKPLTGLNTSTDTKEPSTSDRKSIISTATSITSWMYLHFF